jgi:hypothetical protein
LGTILPIAKWFELRHDDSITADNWHSIISSEDWSVMDSPSASFFGDPSKNWHLRNKFSGNDRTRTFEAAKKDDPSIMQDQAAS